MIQYYIAGPAPIAPGRRMILDRHLDLGEPSFLSVEDILGPTDEDRCECRLYLPPAESVPTEHAYDVPNLARWPEATERLDRSVGVLDLARIVREPSKALRLTIGWVTCLSGGYQRNGDVPRLKSAGR